MLEKILPYFSPELIAELHAVSSSKTYQPGEFVIQKGDSLQKAFIVLEGIIKICQEGPDGEQFILTYLQPGYSFGVALRETTPIQARTAQASLIATETVTVLSLSLPDKDRLAKKYDEWYSYILQNSVIHYKAYLELLDSMAFGNMDVRISFFLQRLSQVRGTSLLQVSHQEIADGLNSSREVISRVLKKLEMEKRIILGHNNIRLLRLSGLKTGLSATKTKRRPPYPQ